MAEMRGIIEAQKDEHEKSKEQLGNSILNLAKDVADMGNKITDLYSTMTDLKNGVASMQAAMLEQFARFAPQPAPTSGAVARDSSPQRQRRHRSRSSTSRRSRSRSSESDEDVDSSARKSKEGRKGASKDKKNSRRFQKNGHD